MDVTNQELAIALAVAELHSSPIINFIPVGLNYTTVLKRFRQKKYVEPKEPDTWVLTDKGRRKFLYNLKSTSTEMDAKFKQIETFVNNL